jgi:hypothetical protein
MMRDLLFWAFCLIAVLDAIGALVLVGGQLFAIFRGLAAG